MGSSTISIAVPQIKTYHKRSYPAISPSPSNNPAFSQAGRTVLVTGGATGIGYEIAKGFIRGSASRVVIIGRRKDVVDRAVSELVAFGKEISSPTQVTGFSVDAADTQATAKFWDEDLKKLGIYIDVLVLNAAVTGPAKPILEVDLEEGWKTFDVNVKSLLNFTQWFWKQGGDRKKVMSIFGTQPWA